MPASSDTVSGQDIRESKPVTSAAEIVVMAIDTKFNKTIHQTRGAMYKFNNRRKCSIACSSGFYKLPSKCVFFFFFFFISYIQRIFLKNMPVQHHPLSPLLNYRKNYPNSSVIRGVRLTVAWVFWVVLPVIQEQSMVQIQVVAG